jgi:hypothetical protein
VSSGEANEFPACAVCGRSILRGERIADYLTPEGDEVRVCSLCKPRAEAAGWTPAALAGRRGGPPESRRRRSVNLRQRLARVSEAAGSRLARRAERQGEPEPADPAQTRREGSAAEPQPPSDPPAPPEPPSPDRAVRRAIDAFNGSPAARTVRGLRRSLGEPRASVRADGSGAVVLTVAWELSWYQWGVEGANVREVAKGNEVMELGRADRDWNAEVTEEGSLRLASQARREQVRG